MYCESYLGKQSVYIECMTDHRWALRTEGPVKCLNDPLGWIVSVYRLRHTNKFKTCRLIFATCIIFAVELRWHH